MFGKIFQINGHPNASGGRVPMKATRYQANVPNQQEFSLNNKLKSTLSGNSNQSTSSAGGKRAYSAFNAHRPNPTILYLPETYQRVPISIIYALKMTCDHSNSNLVLISFLRSGCWHTKLMTESISYHQNEHWWGYWLTSALNWHPVITHRRCLKSLGWVASGDAEGRDTLTLHTTQTQSLVEC